jgi:class 3 adenylate cyclase/tetratricopeptide (TPR) repeat protein
MKCPECQSDNREGVKFCEECGAKLELECSACKAKIPLDKKFCGVCGHRLSAPSEPVPKELSIDEKIQKIQRYLPKGLTEKILSQRDRIEGERKQVTVMFCDLAEYTLLSERLGPEKTYQLMDEIYEMLIHEVHRYEGTVNEMTGDGILALFGAPIALEDAPQRAVRSALSIQREMARIAVEKNTDLQIRIGIHTGTVVVGTLGNDLRVDFKAVGDTVNLAARLEQLAEPGSILISDSTHRQTEGFFRFEAMGEKAVRGIKESISVYSVLGTGKSRSRFEARAERGLTRFVGRGRELEILWDCFERVRKEKGQALSIVAEAGMGKSRIMYEFRKSLANADVTFLEGRCVSFGQNVPYLPIIDVLKDNFRIEPGDSPKEISEKVEQGRQQIQSTADSSTDETIPYLLELFSVENGFDALKDLDPEIKRRKTVEVLKNLILKGSQIRPLVIAIEDLHWIDKTSEESLNILLENIPGTRVFLIFTFRSNYLPPWGAKTYYSQITLNRLSNRESLGMIRALLGAENIEEDLAGLILEKAEGVPFFIEEFVRSLQESGAVNKSDGRCHLGGDITQVLIPETLHDLLMSRVDRLPEGAKEILQIGSVIEREFSWDLLKAVSDPDEMEVLSQLSHLKEAELIFERGIFPQANYIFQHAMTRELVYNSLLDDKRRAYHLAVGEAMEKIFSDRLDEYSPMLALHFTQGGESERGYAYHHKAGKLAAGSYANREAMDHFREAWRFIEKMAQDRSTDEKRLDTAIRLAEVMETLGEFEATLTLLEEVLKSSADKEKNLPGYAGVHYWMGHTCGNLGRYDDARKYLHRSLELSQQSGSIESEGSTHDYLGQLDYMQGYLKSALEHMEAAVKCLRAIGNQTRLAWSVAFKAMIFCDLNIAAHWPAVLQEAEDLVEHSGNERARGALYIIKSITNRNTGQYDQARKLALEGVELAEKIGEGIQIPFLLSYAAIGAVRDGQHEYALQLANKGEAESEKVGHPLGQAILRIAMAEVLLRLGRIEASVVPAQAALVFCRQLDLGNALQRALQLNSEIHTHQIPIDEKKIDEMMQQASALAQRSGSRWHRIDYLLASIRINLKQKKFEIAEERLSEAHYLYEELGLKNGTPELQSLDKTVEEMKSKDRT